MFSKRKTTVLSTLGWNSASGNSSLALLDRKKIRKRHVDIRKRHLSHKDQTSEVNEELDGNGSENEPREEISGRSLGRELRKRFASGDEEEERGDEESGDSHLAAVIMSHHPHKSPFLTPSM